MYVHVQIEIIDVGVLYLNILCVSIFWHATLHFYVFWHPMYIYIYIVVAHVQTDSIDTRILYQLIL